MVVQLRMREGCGCMCLPCITPHIKRGFGAVDPQQGSGSVPVAFVLLAKPISSGQEQGMEGIAAANSRGDG